MMSPAMFALGAELSVEQVMDAHAGVEKDRTCRNDSPTNALYPLAADAE
jgi:hypothetical protein